MFAQEYRLNSKDIRYIQKIRNIAFSDNFRIQRVKQYPNRRYHQISIYIAADKIHRASRRHYIKRRMIEVVKDWNLKINNWQYYKLFISLNPKNVQTDLRPMDHTQRKIWLDEMVEKFKKELPRLLWKLS